MFILILLVRNFENRFGFDLWNEFYSLIVWNILVIIVFMNLVFNLFIVGGFEK